MTKIFTAVNKAKTIGKWITLAIDTMNYFTEQAKERGLTPSDVNAFLEVKNAE